MGMHLETKGRQRREVREEEHKIRLSFCVLKNSHYSITKREQIHLLLIVSTTELSTGAVSHTLNLKANSQTNEVIRTLTPGRCSTRANQTQVTTGQVMVIARIVT